MAKKKIITILKITIITLGIGLFLFLVYIYRNSFINTTKRLLEIFDIAHLKNFIEGYNSKSNLIYDESIKEIEGAVSGAIDSIIETTKKPFDEILANFLLNFLEFTSNLLIYFCNYGINAIMLVYILFHETISGTQLSIKTSPLARFYLIISKSIDKLKSLIKQGLIKLKIILYRERRKIALVIIYYTLSNGFLYKILTEALIFIITYIIRMINLETYLLVLQILQAIFTFTYPKLKYIPLWVLIPLLTILLFLKAISSANLRLRKNHKRLKDFVRDDLTQTAFINGCPGTGKTLLNMSLSLAAEENYIEELEDNLLEYEMKYKNVNFADVRQNKDMYPEHSEYLKSYYLLSERKSFIISNYAIYTPLFEEYSKIFSFDYMRVNKPCENYPLEEYIVISLSEFDKEYNSHDDKKIVGEDGAATFFSTISHDLKRHTKIFVDYQLRQQVPLRIRGNAEYFITIKERKRKYPFLILIYYLPFKGLYKLISLLIKKYETKRKRVSKKSFRKSKSEYKRNDMALLYVILRNIGSTLQKICNWFEGFSYFKLVTNISQEDENDTASKGIKKVLNINIRDLSYKNQRLYDSTFLSFSYEQKKNMEFKDLDTFTKLSPPREELDKCNSRFYDKINH